VYADRGWYGDAWTTVGEKIYEAALEHQCDMIVTTSMGNTHCLDVAEKLNILCFALKFCPDIDGQVPTADFPPSGYPSGPGFMNLLFHVVENLNTV
ncbi:lact-2, partial [Symbiodinium necroappetens]